MPSEEELFTLRAEKRERLLTQGDPYPAKIERTHEAVAAVDLFTEAEVAADAPEGVEAGPVSVVGRVTAQRVMGKAAFLDLTDGSGRIQLHLRRDVLGDAFETLSLVDLGDFLSASGKLFRTRTGEVTVAVAEWSVITKTLRPMPEKWHGIADTEIRYRQRYLDLMSNERSREVARTSSRIVSSVRHFFEGRGFMEVVTPVLQTEAGGAAARPFTTHHNTLDRDLHLRIALELYLKRLLIGGFDKVFEIGRVFRNEGISTRHNPEFLMLESYEAYATYRDVAEMVEELYRHVAQDVVGALQIEHGEHAIDLESPFATTTFRQALIEHGGFDYMQHRDEASLRAVAAERNIAIEGPASWGTVLDRLWSVLAEPHLIQPTFVFDYPVEISPLAKRKLDEPDVVERFELFALGFELANAYSELNDPVEQRERLAQQSAMAAGGDDEVELADEDFLLALEHGMPPAGGLGMGLERLMMLLTGEQSIREVILFPALRDRQDGS
jgi:lysyl-tRNA synthetase class 2